MSSPDLRPAQNFEFGDNPEGQDQNIARMTDLKRAMLHGSAENSKNIVIVAGLTEERFVVNKCLAMLTSGEMEKLIKAASGSNGMLKFPEILPDDFRLILEYTISENNWTYTNLKETCRLVEAAAQLGFYDFIRTIAKSFLPVVQSRDDVFNDEEVCRALILFRNFDVGNHALDYILRNASSLLSGNQYLELPIEDFGEILLQDELRIESELEVLNALIRWGLKVLKNESKVGSTENLHQFLAPLINRIRFPNIAEKEFQDYVIPLQILTEQEIRVMELWYKNGGSISNFNNQPRKYLKSKVSEAAGKLHKSAEELLHATKMDNLLAKHKMNIQTHNLEIQLQNLKMDALKSKVQAEERDTKVEYLETLVKKWQEVIEANRICQKLDALKQYYDVRPIKDTSIQKSESDYNLLKNLVDNLRKGVDVTEPFAEIEEPESNNLQLLESVYETIESKIAVVLKAKYGETHLENLAWTRFQKESDSTVAELQKFSNTQTYACAIVFKNNTSQILGNFQIFNHCYKFYFALPRVIQPFCTQTFGQTGDSYGCTYGVLSYDIGSARIVVRHDFQNTYNDFGIGIAPLTFSTKERTGFDAFTSTNWQNDCSNIKALCKAPTETEKCIKLGNLCLHAELIGSGPKAILRVLLTTV